MDHLSGVGRAHIAEVPGLVGDSGDSFFPRRVALHKAEVRRPLPKSLTDPLVGKIRADEVNLRAPQAQVDGQTGLVLAVAGEGVESSGNLPVFRFRPDEYCDGGEYGR